jgi:hypothetical protein
MAKDKGSGIPTVQVRSWAELLEEIYREAWDPGIERFRSPFVFRGVCNSCSDLSTSLMRLARGYEELSRLEGHILRNFRKYAHLETSADIGKSLWNWMALAQHHGLQTRLLDWTYSPLVAVHFATDDVRTFNTDGAIWCVDHRKANALLPESLRQQVGGEAFDVFTAEMLDRVADTLEKFDSLTDREFVVFLEPPSLDARIVNQFALFSAVNDPTKGMDELLAHNPSIAKKIILPADLKWEVRDKLDQAGITERMLYPGLDGLSRWLSRYYTPNLRGRMR